jgi:hypothetical protein
VTTSVFFLARKEAGGKVVLRLTRRTGEEVLSDRREDVGGESLGAGDDGSAEHAESDERVGWNGWKEDGDWK